MSITNPRQFVPEPEKYENDGEYFKERARFIARKYNAQYPRFSSATQVVNVAGITDPRQRMVGLDNTPIGQIERYYQYYNGQQPNVNYAWSTCDEDGNELPTVWIPGQKVGTLIDHIIGKGQELLDAIKVSARSFSPAATNKKTKQIEKVRFFYEFRKLFKEAGMESVGVQFSPLGGAEEEFDLPEEAYEYLEKTYKDTMEELAYYMARDAMFRNNFRQYFKWVCKQGAIGGLSATELYTEDNKVCWRNYEPWQIIWDNDVDDELNREANFVGLVEYLTPAQIIERYNITKENDPKTYKILTETNDPIHESMYSPLEGSIMRNIFTTKNVVKIAVIRCFWKAPKDTRYETTPEDEYGNAHTVKRKETKKGSGQYWWETWYKATLIGGFAIKDYGECHNNVERIGDKRRLECPVKLWIPNMNLGATASLVGKLYQHQDRKDFIDNEITKLLSVSLGKVGIFRGSKLNSTSIKEIISDFKQFRFTVLDDATGDYDNTASDMKELYSVLDMALDPQLLQQYLVLKAEEDKIMEELVNLSKVALGNQQGYISLQTQQSTIAQNSIANMPFFKSFMMHICDILQHGVNIQKNLYALNGEDENTIPLIGERGEEFLKTVKDIPIEQFGIEIRIDDVMDEIARQRLLSYAQAWSQNPEFGVKPVDILKLEAARTFSEAIAILENSQARGQRDAAKQQQMMMQVQQLEQEQQMAAQQQNLAMQEEGKNYRDQIKAETAVTTTAMKTAASMADKDAEIDSRMTPQQ